MIGMFSLYYLIICLMAALQSLNTFKCPRNTFVSFSWKRASSIYRDGRRASSTIGSRLSAFRTSIMDFDVESLRGTAISDFWIEQLKLLDRPMAINSLKYLYKNSPLGFATTKTTRVASEFEKYRKKEEFKDKILLIRLGDFYETYGIDAVMLVNYCGINFMKTTDNSLKAGCPWKNIQATLDGLTEVGLTVAVFEQLNNNNADKGPSQSTVTSSSSSSSSSLKSMKGKESKPIDRFLSKIVHPGSRIYSYDLSLRTDTVDYRQNKPFWGIMKSESNGYQIYEIYQDEEVINIHDRMTKEAVLTLFHEHGCVDPVFIDTKTMTATELPFLHHTTPLSGYNDKQFLEQLKRRIQIEFGLTTEQLDRFQLQPISITNRPRSLYTSTAQQIGLLDDKNVPNLVPYLLPKASSAHSARFLKKWLLHPPPFELALHMQQLCKHLSNMDISLPQNPPIPVGKIRSFLDARECSVEMFDDILMNVKGVLTVLDEAATGVVISDDTVMMRSSISNTNDINDEMNNSNNNSNNNNNNHSNNNKYQEQQQHHPYIQLIDSLLPIVRFESALPTDPVSLREGCRRIVRNIEAVIAANPNINSGDSDRGMGMGSISNSDVAGSSSAGISNDGFDDGQIVDEVDEDETTGVEENAGSYSTISSSDSRGGIVADIDRSSGVSTNSNTASGTSVSVSDSSTSGRSEGAADKPSTDPTGRVPQEFFNRNEQRFRGKISLLHPVIKQLYQEIAVEVEKLCHVINTQFPSSSSSIPSTTTTGMTAAASTKSKSRLSSSSSSSLQVIPFVDDIMNNVIGIKLPIKITTTSSSSSTKITLTTVNELTNYIHQITGDSTIQFDKVKSQDSNAKRDSAQIKKTTKQVQDAMDSYLTKVAEADSVIQKLLQELCESLQPDMTSLVQSAHWAVILGAAHAHTKSAMQKGWILPDLENSNNDDGDDDGYGNAFPPSSFTTSPSQQQLQQQQYQSVMDSNNIHNRNSNHNNNSNNNNNNNNNNNHNKYRDMRVTGLTPYWMNRDDAIANDICLNGLFLLTAPNMSGKSTLMRSTMVLALLANCGLYVPATTAYVPRYDNFFMRTSSHDIPSEAKSAYALEMDDMRVLHRDCTSKSIVMVDELGKGTSSKGGATMAGAVLEHWDALRCCGIFATHLHQIFQLPLKYSHSHIHYKRIGLDENNRWTYKLEDGVCTDSMSLVTAAEYGIPQSIIDRARELEKDYDRIFGGNHDGSGTSSSRSSNKDNSSSSNSNNNTGSISARTPASSSSSSSSSASDNDNSSSNCDSDNNNSSSSSSSNGSNSSSSSSSSNSSSNGSNSSSSSSSSSKDVTDNTAAASSADSVTGSKTAVSVPSVHTSDSIITSSISSNNNNNDDDDNRMRSSNTSINMDSNNDMSDTTISRNTLRDGDDGDDQIIFTPSSSSSVLLSSSSSSSSVLPSSSSSSSVLPSSSSSSSSSSSMRTPTPNIHSSGISPTTTTVPKSTTHSPPVPNSVMTTVTADLSHPAGESAGMSSTTIDFKTRRSKKKMASVADDVVNVDDNLLLPVTSSLSSSSSALPSNDKEMNEVNSILSDNTTDITSTSSSSSTEVTSYSARALLNYYQRATIPSADSSDMKVSDTFTVAGPNSTDASVMFTTFSDIIHDITYDDADDDGGVDLINTFNASSPMSGGQSDNNISSGAIPSSSSSPLVVEAKEAVLSPSSSSSLLLVNTTTTPTTSSIHHGISNQQPPLRSYSLESIEPILKTFGGTRKVYIIEPLYTPPLTLEGMSCVYVLHIQSRSYNANNGGGGAEWLYVGETESINQRLKQHRRTYKDSIVRTAVIPTPSKSSARYIETKVIGKLKQEGYTMGKDSDERHTMFGGAAAMAVTDSGSTAFDATTKAVESM